MTFRRHYGWWIAAAIYIGGGFAIQPYLADLFSPFPIRLVDLKASQ